MKLYYAPQSPFARKVRAAAIELDLADRISLEFARVAPGKRNERYGELVNPLCKVPSLVTEDGAILTDSMVICDFLNHRAGGGRLIPREDDPRRWSVLTQHAIAHGICEAAVSLRYEMALRPEAHRWPAWIADQWQKIWAGLEWFERRAEILENGFDLSHLTLAISLGYIDFRYPDAGWRDRCPRVGAWYDHACNRPSLAGTRPLDPSPDMPESSTLAG